MLNMRKTPILNIIMSVFSITSGFQLNSLLPYIIISLLKHFRPCTKFTVFPFAAST